MAIQLAEIVDAVYAYDAKLVRKIKNVTPTSGGTINADETFNFTIEVTNPPKANGGVSLVDVTFNVQVGDPATAMLIVPPAATGVATTAPVNGATLTPGQEVANYSLHKYWAINPGQTVTVDLQGVAKKAGNTQVGFHVSFNVAAFALRPTGVAVAPVTIIPVLAP